MHSNQWVKCVAKIYLLIMAKTTTFFFFTLILTLTTLVLTMLWSGVLYRFSNMEHLVRKGHKYNRPRNKTSKRLLYMTFDDGPNFGTEVVLDAFKASGGRGTFFINCLRICTCETKLEPVYYEKGNCSANQAALLRMVQEGHTLGDHSSDHMAHNHVGHGFHYVNGKRDLPYFNEANIAPIAAFLRGHGVEESLVARAEETMRVVKRLPFTDIWHVPGVRTISKDTRARRVAGAIGRAGGNVYGWDLHWGLHWNMRTRRETRQVVGVQAMIAQLKSGRGRLPGKIVFLSHDYIHLRPDTSNPRLDKTMVSGSKDLEIFITGALSKGWSLRTLETYPTD